MGTNGNRGESFFGYFTTRTVFFHTFHHLVQSLKSLRDKKIPVYDVSLLLGTNQVHQVKVLIKYDK